MTNRRPSSPEKVTPLPPIEKVSPSFIDRDMVKKESRRGLQHESQNTGAEMLRTEPQFTGLSLAAWQGNIEEVRSLIANGDNIDGLDDYGLNPLHRAIITGNEEMVRVLIDEGANIDMPNEFGLIPSELAEHYNHPNITDLLLENS